MPAEIASISSACAETPSTKVLSLRDLWKVYGETVAVNRSRSTWAAVDIMLRRFISRYLNSIRSPAFSFISALLEAVLFLFGIALRVFAVAVVLRYGPSARALANAMDHCQR